MGRVGHQGYCTGYPDRQSINKMYFICLLYVNVESTLFIALVQLIIPTIRHYYNNNIVKILSKLCMWLSLIRSLDGEVLGLTAVGCQIFTTETRRSPISDASQYFGRLRTKHTFSLQHIKRGQHCIASCT